LFLAPAPEPDFGFPAGVGQRRSGHRLAKNGIFLAFLFRQFHEGYDSTGGGGPMRCITCGDRMRLVERVPDNTMFVSGYEHHTSECLSCGETERRLVFRRSDEPLQEELPTAPECDEALSETALLVPTEPQPDGLALRAVVLAPPRRLEEFRPLAAPQRTLSGRRTDIESLRARLDDLRQRAELSGQKAMAAKRDEEERKRFVEFWDGLVPPKLSAQT
jgi:hypothetical protein